MRYARTLKIVDHDGTAYHYENVLYREDSAGLHIHYTVTWGMADIERMEVDCHDGSYAEAIDHISDRARDAAMDEVQRAGISGPYDYVTGRTTVQPFDDSGSDHGC